MRKLVVIEHISLDGVIQGPGGPDEDRSGGFSHGGWISGHSDPVLAKALRVLMDSSFDLLLGRRTYDIWAPYWPLHKDAWPSADRATKHVVSRSLADGPWKPLEILRGDLGEGIKALKERQGPDLHLWGSGEVARAALDRGLVDELRLFIYPIALGSGKKLWGELGAPASFSLRQAEVSSTGVIIAGYERRP